MVSIVFPGPQFLASMERTTAKILTIALALISTALCACTDNPTELRFAQPSSPVDRAIVTDLVELFADDTLVSLNLTGAEFTGEEALDAIIAGEVDVALVSNALPYRDGVATVIPLFPSVLHIAYVGDDRDPSDIYSLLEGANVFAGEEGSASRLIFEQSLERAHTANFNYVDAITEANVVILFARYLRIGCASFPRFDCSVLALSRASAKAAMLILRRSSIRTWRHSSSRLTPTAR